MNVPKKWWWLVGVAVPIVAAAIAIVPDLIRNGDTGGGDTFTVIGTQSNTKVTFNNVSVIVEQANQTGEELSQSVVETLRQALKLAQSRKFDQAIPLLESVEDSALVPALLNNLGAVYLATGNQEKAKQYFEQALAYNPEEETPLINLKQIPPGPVVGARLVNFSSQAAGEDCRIWKSCAAYILDGKPYMGWVSADGKFPQTFVVELPREFLISSFSFDNAARGEEDRAAKDVEIYVSLEAAHLGYQEIDTFTLIKGEIAQGFKLASSVRARWIKLNILSNYGNANYTELMEFRIVGQVR